MLVVLLLNLIMVNLTMTSQCGQCEHNGYSYVSSCGSSNFRQASKICQNEGGLLASDLDRKTYLKLNECFNSSYQYFIGLVTDTADQCKIKSAHQFLWVGSGNCTDGSPLNVPGIGNRSKNQLSNTILNAAMSIAKPKCRAVTIRPQFDRNLIPSASLLDRTAAERYICQFEIRPTLSSTFSTMTPMINKTDEIAPASSTSVENSAALNSNFIVGVVIGVIVLILLIALSLLFYKKGYLKFRRITNSMSFPTSDSKQVQNNPLYDGVMQPSAESFKQVNVSQVDSVQNVYVINEETNEYNTIKDPSGEPNPSPSHVY